MRLKHVFSVVATAISATFLSACGEPTTSRAMLTELAPVDWADAASSFTGPSGEEMGAAIFTNGPEGVLIRVDLQGLSEGWHAMHLHQVGDCSDGAAGFKASKSHVNPDDNAHGLLNPEGNERADIPNIYAGPDGRATAEIYRVGLSLYPSEAGTAQNGPFPLLDDDGFAVIVHENPDDHLTQPIGGAGARVACAAFG